MFTGIVEEIGRIKTVQPIPGGMKFRIQSEKILDDISVNDSVAINGVCLTATKIETDGFYADAVGDTLKKTTLVNLAPNSVVNLERAVRLIDRFGGHLVQGHVNGVGIIKQIKKLGDNYYMEVKIPKELTGYVITEGSIAIDGISLTIAKLENTNVGVSVIPHTWENTNLKTKKQGDHVNIETDVIAKYIEKLLSNKNQNDNTFTDDWFNRLGYK